MGTVIKKGKVATDEKVKKCQDKDHLQIDFARFLTLILVWTLCWQFCPGCSLLEVWPSWKSGRLEMGFLLLARLGCNGIWGD